MESAVQFGAGNIGRGFMGQLFFEAGMHTVFVDSNEVLVGKINERQRYTLRLLDAYSKQEHDLTIVNVSALSTSQASEIAAAFAKARAISTAVGVENLKAVAPLIAAGVVARRRIGGPPVDVYLCENHLGASAVLRREVVSLLDGAERSWADVNVGFVGTSVARMVPAPHERFTSEDPLLVVADSYHTLPYDSAAARAPRLAIDGMHPVSNFRAEVERKLFTHNLGHAALAYLGYLKGYSFVHETFRDQFIAEVFTEALQESGRALLAKYPRDLDPGEHREILVDVRVRFSNPMIMDGIQRVARDPVRKLGPDDRLIGSARLCLEQNVTPTRIALACGAALCYDPAGDASAARLQGMIRSRGVEAALEEVSGVSADDTLCRTIVEEYRKLSKLRAAWKTG